MSQKIAEDYAYAYLNTEHPNKCIQRETVEVNICVRYAYSSLGEAYARISYWSDSQHEIDESIEAQDFYNDALTWASSQKCNS